MFAYSTCTPGCTNSHHTAMCVNDRMTIDESRVIEEVYRNTPPRSRPGQIATVANNSDLRLWAEPSTLLAVEHALAANEIMRNNILYGGIDVADPYMSYGFRLGVSERVLSPLSNMAPAAAVAEMPTSDQETGAGRDPAA